MKSSTPKVESHGRIALVEEAVQVLRRTSAQTLAAFYIGAIPFVLGLLYFWADMSRGAYADRRLGGGTLLLAALFVWMKTWHAVFCTNLYTLISGGKPGSWTFFRLWSVALLQTAVQPWGLIIKPIAFLITLPYPWARGFFEHLLICPGDVSLRIRPSVRRAATDARLWPGASVVSLVVLAGFSIFLAVNVGALIMFAPSLYRMILGEETTFTRSSYSFLNSTFLAASIAGAYLCLNPIVKAVFVLRTFYGASIQSGADLRLQLRQLRAAVGMLTLTLFLWAAPTQAADTNSPRVVSSVQLDEKIDSVLQRPEYAWREPRVLDPTKDKGWMSEIRRAFMETLRGWIKPIGQTLERMLKKWADWLRNRHFSDEKDPASGMDWSRSVPWLLGAGMAILLGLIGWLIWKQPRRKVLVAKATAPSFAPDLTSEDLTADQLPEEGWLTLAREMLEKGEVRLALRAFYLATLTQLGSRQWITLARHKSNRDYELELLRKGRSPQSGRDAFSATRLIFERVWYGTYEATPEAINAVEANMEKIRQC